MGMRDSSNTLLSDSVQPASSLAERLLRPRIATRIGWLDAALGGGLAPGELSEWGLPWGHGGRELIVAILAAVMRTDRALWIQTGRQISIYPPAWAARGIDLQRIRFTHSRHPLKELLPLFTEPFFATIVIDDDERVLRRADGAFLAHQARSLKCLILLLRDGRLRAEQGNVWARFRGNVQRVVKTEQMTLEILRGGAPRPICFDLQSLQEVPP